VPALTSSRELAASRLLALALLAAPLSAQSFGPALDIAAEEVLALETSDLDGDGDADVLVCSLFHGLRWFRNGGAGSFAGPVDIDGSQPWSKARAADLDADGDLDLLTCSSSSQVAWFENLGGGSFSGARTIDASSAGPSSVDAADLDGDGDLDVLVAETGANRVVWYPNVGGASFAGAQFVNAAISFPRSAIGADLDGDGDLDVLHTSASDNEVAWTQNLGSGVFGGATVIEDLIDALDVVAADFDRDGDLDVVVEDAGLVTRSVRLVENLGGGAFAFSTPTMLIDSLQYTGFSLEVADLDADGWDDLVVGMTDSVGGVLGGGSRIQTFMNDGVGSLLPAVTLVSLGAVSGIMLGVADLDGDADLDLVHSSLELTSVSPPLVTGSLVWSANLLSAVDCNGNGIDDALELALGITLDCNGNGRPDECDIASGAELDLDGNGIPDSCLTPPLTGSPLELSAAAGGTQALELLAPAFATKTYLVLGSASGTSPGLPLGSVVLPLATPDPYFDYTLNSPNSGALSSTLGTLDGLGRASAAISVPPGLSGLVGTTLHHAFIVIEADISFSFASNAVPLSFSL